MKNNKKIYITNLPSFYKINLLNRINDKERIFVIFTGNKANIRNSDFFKRELIQFDYKDLKELSFTSSCFYVLKVVLLAKYDELIIGGWDETILWIANVFGKRNRKSLIVESSIYDSQVTGLKAIVKKIFLCGITKVYASGASQIELIQELAYSGEIIKTKGVGVFNIQPQLPFEERKFVQRFLYVGRLSKEKNLEQLIKLFNEIPKLTLYIIGFGPEEEYLKSISLENVIFLGAINNEELFKFYKKYDVLILPSIIEPWGLVVEEALNNGMPVIISNRVGCGKEIVNNGVNGLIFGIDERNGLKDSVLKMTKVHFYNYLRRNVSEMNFEEITEFQVKAYLRDLQSQ